MLVSKTFSVDGPPRGWDGLMNLPLWMHRADAVSMTLYSAPVEVSFATSITLFLSVAACPMGNSATLSVEHSLDPSDPSGWDSFGAAPGASGPSNAVGVAGGNFGGTDVPVGPYVRFKAVIVVATGGIVWSAAAVLRRS